MTLLLSTALRTTVLLALALGATALLRRRSASERRLVLLLGLAGSLLLAAIAFGIPGRPMAHVVPSQGMGNVVLEALSAAPAPEAVRPSSHGQSTAAPAFRANTIALGGWLVGLAVALLRLAHGVLQTRRLLGRAKLVRTGVALSRDVSGPVVAGYLRPCVLLPLCAREWSAERERVVLAHELAHVRRRDGLALLIGQLVCAIHWFNPLSWLVSSRLRRECELAADEDVLATGVRPSSYADHLIAIARTLTARADVVAMAARPSELSRRIDALLADRTPHASTRRATFALCAAAALSFAFVACADGARRPATTHPSAAIEARSADASVQTLVAREADRTRSEWKASRVAIVVVRPADGAVLGLSDDAEGRSIRPASTLKPLTVALALQAGKIREDQRIDCGNGSRTYGAETLRDANPYGLLTLTEMLAVSSNVGISRVFDELGADGLREGLSRFGIAVPDGVERGTVAGAMTAIGQRISTTPLALARAYAVLANGGMVVASERAPARVLDAKVAAAMTGMLENAVTGERATGRAAQIAGVRVAGKTGTSQDERVIANFVGWLPVESPRYVIYVGVELGDPAATAPVVAAPVFARIGRQLLDG